MCLDPPPGTNPFWRARFEHANKRKGAPKRGSFQVGLFIAVSIDRGEKQEAAVTAAMSKFRLSRQTCLNALAEVRDLRKSLNIR